MARVGLADSVYGEGTDGCDRNIVRFNLSEGHCSGKEGRGAE